MDVIDGARICATEIKKTNCNNTECSNECVARHPTPPNRNTINGGFCGPNGNCLCFVCCKPDCSN